MYNKTNNYKKLEPVGYSLHLAPNYGVSNGYGNSADSYKSLVSESKCRCRGTCRTGIGCTCKDN
ncbi:MAG: hypothetical protein ACP5N1_05415 [Candidatus Woesearchaeota archaeon]